ncbi:MAG TPA: hypothetical protein VK983_00195 [Candidatus Limnocylindrales bacterium]|nr:hypothetical protein [Candidatus Limnocylindrales bacterium]
MKQKDIAVIIAIMGVSAFISFFAGRFAFATAKDRQQKAEVVDVISTDFTQPNNKYFNGDAINPTLPIQIGDGPNAAPFTGR